jgi:hypothetical protein
MSEYAERQFTLSDATMWFERLEKVAAIQIVNNKQKQTNKF